MRIVVTQKDINEGEYRSCHHCPIALAIQRRTKARSVLVGPAVISLNGTDTIIRTPKKALDFILDFDTFRPVSPMHFELELP